MTYSNTQNRLLKFVVIYAINGTPVTGKVSDDRVERDRFSWLNRNDAAIVVVVVKRHLVAESARRPTNGAVATDSRVGHADFRDDNPIAFVDVENRLEYVEAVGCVFNFVLPIFDERVDVCSA